MKVILVVISCVVSLLSAEIVLRVFFPEDITPTSCRSDDSILHHKLVANAVCRWKTSEWDITYKINSMGFRDDEIIIHKPKDIKRIVVLGDSFVEGWGVKDKDRFTEKLEEKLQDITDKSIEVVNMGVASYSPLTNYVWLKNSGLSLQPDLVILTVSPQDLVDDLNRWREALIKDDDIKAIPPSFPYSAVSEDRYRSLLFHRLDKVTREAITFLKFFKTHRRFPSKPSLYNQYDPYSDVMIFFREKDSQWIQVQERYFTLYRKGVELIRKLLVSHNIPLVIVVYPANGNSVKLNEWNEGRKAWGFERDTMVSNEVYTELQKVSAPTALTLDITPVFQASEKYPLYFPIDGHWTVLGHDVAAQAVAEWLTTDHVYQLLAE